jgi:putative flippase GtrA
VSRIFDHARTPAGKKAVRYTLASVTFVIAFGVVRASARSSAITATAIGSVPSYYLNRYWAWGKSGRSHFWKEIVPFWVIAFIGLAFSTWSSDAAETYVNHHHYSHLVKTLMVTGAYFGAFALLWVAKFVIFNKLLFVTKDEDLQAALGNEVVG